MHSVLSTQNTDGRSAAVRTSGYGEEDNEEDTYPLGGDVSVWILAEVGGLVHLWRHSDYGRSKLQGRRVTVQTWEDIHARQKSGPCVFVLHG